MFRINFTIIAVIAITINLSAQVDPVSETEDNSPSSKEIVFTPNSASKYINDLLDKEYLWKPGSNSIKTPLSRLIEQYDEAYDSVINELSQKDLKPTTINKGKVLLNDTLAIRWLNDSTFIFDTLKLGKEPLYVKKTVIHTIIDSIKIIGSAKSVDDSTLTESAKKDSIVRKRDTIISKKDYVTEVIIDTALLSSKNLKLYQIKNKQIFPNPFPADSKKTYHFTEDGSRIIISKPVHVYVTDSSSPFYYVPNKKMPDSLNAAIQTLLKFTGQRDSVLVYLNNNEGASKPFWLTSGKDELQRYWVKNHRNDSVSLWLGNPIKNNISLALEDDIIIDRIEEENIDDVSFTMATPKDKLAKVESFEEIPVFWSYDFSTSLTLSENYLSNWVQGGENSVSSLIDIQGEAKYVNKESKIEWTNDGRLKIGSIITEEDNEYDFRKNTDFLEFNSKYNKEIKSKIDFSTIFYMKNQLANGFNYPNDSVIISKFLNPGTFTIGTGIEYKPVKSTTINFSVLSYKNTFVLDTVNIDQTNHGIDEGKRANQEMGGQLLIENELTAFSDLKVDNSLRLFSNYIEKPQNIDVEWELELEKQISMYFTIVFNIHIIYDDDIRITELDENGDAILLSDGTEKKTPKLQLNQYLGLTFIVSL